MYYNLKNLKPDTAITEIISKKILNRLNKKLNQLRLIDKETATNLTHLIRNLIYTDSINSSNITYNDIIATITQIIKILEITNRIRNYLLSEIELCNKEIDDLKYLKINLNNFLLNNSSPTHNDISELRKGLKIIPKIISELTNKKKHLNDFYENYNKELRENIIISIRNFSKKKAIFERKKILLDYFISLKNLYEHFI